jgi:hypothetical protein
MLFMNRDEVSDAAQLHAGKPIIGEATALLARFVELIDDNSDGWPYWSKGPKAAKKLMELIQSQDVRGRAWDDPCPKLTEDDLKQAVRPIKAFCTRHKFTFPR